MLITSERTGIGVQRGEGSRLVEAHPALEPPGEGLGELVPGEARGGHGEDEVEFFEGFLLHVTEGVSSEE
jgi:hypothetical protein